MLSRIRVVLVGTTHPGNIGAAARAMKTMCLSRLHLVSPEKYPCAEATARASGADDVLAQAQVHDSLDAALAGCSLVFGASARRRTIQWPEVDPRECAALALAESAAGEVALVFGREHSGLTNAELERCHYLLHIPSNPDYSSLNLAAAVQVIAYEVMMAGDRPAAPAVEEPPDRVTAAEMEKFYDHLQQTLFDIAFLDPANPRQLMRRLRRLFNRVQLDRNEYNILRGILTETQKKTGVEEPSNS
ncbi:MAG: tRNA (cytosine(32)/uridine(32)-2'-O)-methyltransferase TrmJ [Gammaproteobacteria bacterium]|nr:tRNA (cytosine(32)/uridine(32)-2'-O)-methyltransferase TrmJ [Gammaproteobacteria bacterium]